MSREAIDIALNALIVLQDDYKLDTSRLKEVLPALALDFHKSGRELTESALVTAILHAHDRQLPLQALFSEVRRKNTNTALSYEDVAGRLNPDFYRPEDPERMIRFGHLKGFGRRGELDTWDNKAFMELVRSSARMGHSELCCHAIAFCDNRLAALTVALQAALEKDQYHLVYETIEEMTDDEKDHVLQPVQENISSIKRQGFMAFKKLYKDHHKSNPNILPEEITGLEDMQNMSVRMAPYLGIREFLSQEEPNVRLRNKNAFVATMLFQSPQRLLQFIDRWGEKSPAPIVHMLNQIDAPLTKHVKWHLWGDALIKYGPALFYPIHFARQFPEPVRGDNGEISLRATQKAIWNKCFSQDKEMLGVSTLCYVWKVKSEDIPAATELWANRMKIDPAPPTRIPDIDMSCATFGLPDYTLKKISHDDPRIMFLGYYTGCCEKIGDFFEETVEASLKTRRHGYYILTRDDQIMAHTWAWRGEKGQLIIDGWESKDPNIDSEALAEIVTHMANEFAGEEYAPYEISDVLLGLSGENLTPQSYFRKSSQPAERFVCQWYFSDPFQWHVRRINPPSDYSPG